MGMTNDVTVYWTLLGIGAVYLLLMNLLGFYSMWKDKKKAKKGEWRTPERELILIALLGGSVGSLLGMKKFRHKTKHAKFTVGIPVIIGLQVVVVIVLWWLFEGR